jgi:hypothetical protein
MKRFRLPVIVAGALALLVVLAVVVAFSSAFQTWAVRKAIGGRPGLQVTVGNVSAGLGRVELSDVRYVQSGAVLTLPRVEVELPVFAAAWDNEITVRRLVAKGWTLDFSAPTAATPAASANAVNAGPVVQPAAAPAPAASITAPTMAAQAFAGVFGQLRLPVDVAVDGLQLEGEVILPQSRGRVKVTLSGGGLAAGKEGRFDLLADAALTDPAVNAVQARGAIVGRMDTARSFTQLAARLDASATGTKFPRGVKLHTDVSANRAERGEKYAAVVVAEGQEVLAVNADWPTNAPAFAGTWKVDLRDADLAPFLLGFPVPTFTAVGEGSFDGDVRFESLHVAGRLNGTLDRLQVIQPELEKIGELKVAADFDLAGIGSSFMVRTLEAAINTAQPVATVRALQPFQLNLRTGEMRTADAARELVGVALHAVPVAWVAPFLKDVAVSGGHLRGELSATTRAGGVTLRSLSPLVIDDVSIARAGKPVVAKVDLALGTSADYTPQGWQAEISSLTAKVGDTLLATLDAKAGQLAGREQPLKATGKLNANLPAILAQPALAGVASLTSGNAALDFVVSFSAKQEIQANVLLSNLGATIDNHPIKLPTVRSNLRADLAGDGRIAFNAPIQLEHADRKSDLTLVGAIGPEKDKLRSIDAEVTSTQLMIDDAQLFAGVVGGKSARTASAGSAEKPPADRAPPWAGLYGSITLQLKSIIYSDAVQMSNVTGRLRIEAGTLKLEGLQAGLGETGRATVSGTVTFHEATPQPYALAADVVVREFDAGALFRNIATSHPATVEGRFDVTSKLVGRAGTLGELATAAGGNFHVTSKGGVFRGLPVNVGNIVENTSKLAAWIASAGTAITAIAGKKEYADVANKAEAVAELARGLNPIPYDQLSVLVTRDAALNTTLRNFTLISPEVRLTGNGTALHKPGSTLLDDSLAMEYTLRARGRQGELLRYLGALDAHTDDLGYAACTVPLKVAGTLGKPDTSELNTKLTALAIEKSGFGDKAAEFLARIRGAKP